MLGELTIRILAPSVAMLSLLFQLWIAQSLVHESEEKKSDVDGALEAPAASRTILGGFKDGEEMSRKSWKRWLVK